MMSKQNGVFHGEDKKMRRLEFGGKWGTLALVFGLPAAVLYINSACGVKDALCHLWPLAHLPSVSDVLSLRTFLTYVAWFSFQLILAVLPVGTVAIGLPLKTGQRLKYRCNGLFALIISMIAYGVAICVGVDMSFVFRDLTALAGSAIIFSFGLSLFLYFKASRISSHALASGGNSGITVYDFFMGRELNPRIGPIDLKFFCELRPGLIGWVILDFSFLAVAISTKTACPAIALVTFFHVLYVADALLHEPAILSTMDIVHDGFGFMLAFGDLAWVPFNYSLQVLFLLQRPQQWSGLALTGFFVLNMLGFYIFRQSNSQKDRFRNNPTDPEFANIQTLSTSSGKKLLTSGWWGMCRHPNYLGDLIMAFAWSMPCGFTHLLPYFYPFYFLGLLIHRSQRDDASCRLKYGVDWDKYCKLVPYRIIPYVF